MQKNDSLFTPEDAAKFEDQASPTLSPADADEYFGATKKTLAEEKQRQKSAIAAIIKNQPTDPLFTPKEASLYIGAGEQTLAVWRCTGRYSIPYVKVGRLVRYRKSALDRFLERRTIGGGE